MNEKSVYEILLISDTHGLNAKMKAILERHIDCDFKIHCGDSEMPANYMLERFDYAVSGNNDFSNLPEIAFLKLHKFKILITHSHLLASRFHPQKDLSDAAIEHDCNVVFYGHSHIADDTIYNNVRIINPGSVFAPRSSRGPTYMIVSVSENNLKVKLMHA